MAESLSLQRRIDIMLILLINFYGGFNLIEVFFMKLTHG